MKLSLLLLLIPPLTLLSGIILYGQHGKREILKLDFVQFVYSFVIAPVIFIWLKTFIFFILRNELNVRLSISEIFIVDTIYSTLAMFIFAFVVIHSLTKSFNLKRESDPLYDMFEHSEYFHWNLSHLVIYVGAMTIASFVSFTNVLIPLTSVIDKPQFYTSLTIASVVGLLGFIGVWNYESPSANFMRIMKLFFGVFFLAHVALYYFLEPPFNGTYLGYWFVLFMFTVTVVLSLFAEKREQPARIPFRLNPRKIQYYWRFLRQKLPIFYTRT